MNDERLADFLALVEAPEHDVNEVLPRTGLSSGVVLRMTPGLLTVAVVVVGKHAVPAVTHVRENKVPPHVLELVLRWPLWAARTKRGKVFGMRLGAQIGVIGEANWACALHYRHPIVEQPGRQLPLNGDL